MPHDEERRLARSLAPLDAPETVPCGLHARDMPVRDPVSVVAFHRKTPCHAVQALGMATLSSIEAVLREAGADSCPLDRRTALGQQSHSEPTARTRGPSVVSLSFDRIRLCHGARSLFPILRRNVLFSLR